MTCSAERNNVRKSLKADHRLFRSCSFWSIQIRDTTLHGTPAEPITEKFGSYIARDVHCLRSRQRIIVLLNGGQHLVRQRHHRTFVESHEECTFRAKTRVLHTVTAFCGRVFRILLRYARLTIEIVSVPLRTLRTCRIRWSVAIRKNIGLVNTIVNWRPLDSERCIIISPSRSTSDSSKYFSLIIVL